MQNRVQKSKKRDSERLKRGTDRDGEGSWKKEWRACWKYQGLRRGAPWGHHKQTCDREACDPRGEMHAVAIHNMAPPPGQVLCRGAGKKGIVPLWRDFVRRLSPSDSTTSVSTSWSRSRNDGMFQVSAGDEASGDDFRFIEDSVYASHAIG